MIWLLALLGLQYAVHQLYGDPGDENDARVPAWHERDGWPHEGCACEFCTELRTRPVNASVPYELPDEAALQSGLHAMAHYIKQQEHDGPDELIEHLNVFEQRGLILLRSERLTKAVAAEAKSQRVVGGGDAGVI